VTAGPAPAPLPPEVLERLRTIGLRIDGAGGLWHQGSPIVHLGLRQAILRWLDVRDDGRVIVRLDDVRYAYVDVDDTPLRVTAIRWVDGAPVAHTDDGQVEPLDLATVTVDPDQRARCRVRGGRLEARLTSPAHQVLFERADERAGVYGVVAAGRFWPLTAAPPSPPA
jgi:hypothetical protein